MPIDRCILENATKILCISDQMMMYLSKTRKIETSKFTLIRNWQDDEKFLNLIQSEKGHKIFTFMYVGSISASAGVDVLIEAFHKSNLPNSKLIIAGDGSEKCKCVKIAEELDNRNIEFHNVSPENVAEIQSKSDVLLLPLKKGISRTATPSKLTAYLYSSKPVIACVESESDVANILLKNKCGFVVDPENTESLSSKLKYVYNLERSKLSKIGENGREYARDNLSRLANLNKIEGVFNNVKKRNF
jgi:glycosyltransferase involved in cell wall biosynthesis